MAIAVAEMNNGIRNALRITSPDGWKRRNKDWLSLWVWRRIRAKKTQPREEL
ncbi:MAG TPA: hypothetical protein VGG56_17350 [Terracidiphilus sp.]